jgi:Tfp pilus assembly protein PilO
MKRLPPAKRNNLILVVAATVIILSLVYFLLIQAQKEQNENVAHQTSDQYAELEKIKKSIAQNPVTDTQLADIAAQLQRAEGDVGTGDVFVWTYDTIRRFKANYHVDIPNIGQPSISDVDMISSFPYKQVKVSLSGTAYYHDLGKFVADFENTFPHMRMVNLSVEPAVPSSPGEDNEKLSFRVDVIALVKPNT